MANGSKDLEAAAQRVPDRAADGAWAAAKAVARNERNGRRKGGNAKPAGK